MFKILIASLLIDYCLIHAAYNCTQVQLKSTSNGAELLAYLTHPCFYDKYTPPLHGFDKLKTDRISAKLHVYYLNLKPALSLKFEIQLLVQFRWKDPRLKFENITSTIDKISGESEFVNQIWTPHIYLATERSPLIRGKLNKDIAVHVLPDGTVLYTSRLITEIVCWVKLGRFPMDKQKCQLNIDTWKFKSSQLILKWEKGTAVTISNEASFLAEYQLIDTVFFTDYEYGEPDSIYMHHREYNCSSLKVVFFVARNYGYYFMNYYVPSILLVIVSWVTFWEAPDAIPGRCLLGTGTLLTFIVLGIEVSKSLPTVPYIRSNDLWFIGCTAFIFCSLAEFAFVNTLWRYGGEVELKKATSKYILKSSVGIKQNVRPRRRSLSCPSSPTARWENPFKRVVNNELTVKSLSDLEISLPLSELKTMRKETLEISEKLPEPPTKMTMQEIAIWIDKKSRIIFPVCFLLFNTLYWTLLLVS